MRRSTFVLLGLGTFASILGTFVVRGSTRLIVGDRVSLLLATPFAVLSLVLLGALLVLVIGEVSGIVPMEDDLDR